MKKYNYTLFNASGEAVINGEASIRNSKRLLFEAWHNVDSNITSCIVYGPYGQELTRAKMVNGLPKNY